MRLWSIHPRYLDAKGLVALWREGLLAQKVLLGRTKGYTRHPQLDRFKKTANPVAALASYLRSIADEADNRGYRFNREKIEPGMYRGKIRVTDGQLQYEFNHLLRKLQARDPLLFDQLQTCSEIKAHPLFKKIPGAIEKWEIV